MIGGRNSYLCTVRPSSFVTLQRRKMRTFGWPIQLTRNESTLLASSWCDRSVILAVFSCRKDVELVWFADENWIMSSVLILRRCYCGQCVFYLEYKRQSKERVLPSRSSVRTKPAPSCLKNTTASLLFSVLQVLQGLLSYASCYCVICASLARDIHHCGTVFQVVPAKVWRQQHWNQMGEKNTKVCIASSSGHAKFN